MFLLYLCFIFISNHIITVDCQTITDQSNHNDTDIISISDKTDNNKKCDDIFPYYGNIYIHIKQKYFKFIDVAGDGDCFFHSILKSELLSRFCSVHQLRTYLGYMTEAKFTNDHIIQNIFAFHRVSVYDWLERIRTMGTWANELDMLLTAYILQINIVSVGNYMNGFILNNMQLNLNMILQCNDIQITEQSIIHIDFHTYKNPLARGTDGNHFAYMQPIHFLPDQNNLSPLNIHDTLDQKSFPQLNFSNALNPALKKVPSLIDESHVEENRPSYLNMEDCTNENHTNNIPPLCDTIDRKGPLNKCLKLINRTCTGNSYHKACVCVVCDCFIIGTEKVCWLTEEQLHQKSQCSLLVILNQLLERDYLQH